MKPVLAVLLALSFCLPLAAQQNSQPEKQPAKQDKQKSRKQDQAQAQKSPEPPAAEEQPKPEPPKNTGDQGKDDKEERFDVSEVAPVVTHHQLTVNGAVLNYTATTGRLPLKRPDGKIEAEMFFVAYTLDDQDHAKRPLTFAFNGGPGSSTIWLHMGALGPKRVAMKPDGFMPPPPYRVEDNPYTLLDKSDLVFIDAMSTGFSRAINSETSKNFLGLQGDIKAFGEFIRLYLTRYERWTSPLFLFGESYGTTRAAGLAGYLADRGVSFNGITLLSMALRFQTLADSKSNDEPYILLIPSFTMIAGYHHKLPPDLAADMGKARQLSEDWANTTYAQALSKGDALMPEERGKVIEDMARSFTGLSKEVIDQANLRIDVGKFTHYLLIDRKLRVGRYDGRFTGTDPDGLLDTGFYDPSQSAFQPPYTSNLNNYVRTELGYKTDMPYGVFSEDESFGKNWDWGSAENGYPDTATALREAMVKNPYMKVQVLEGYYDLATPYAAANYTMNHLDLGPQFHGNFSVSTYEAGHMVYLRLDQLKKMKADTAEYMDQALAGK